MAPHPKHPRATLLNHRHGHLVKTSHRPQETILLLKLPPRRERRENIWALTLIACFRVWLRLFTTGADENYVAELKEFVLGAMAAYDAGYSQPALILELGRHELETGDPNVDKTVRLTDQERQTREVIGPPTNPESSALVRVWLFRV